MRKSFEKSEWFNPENAKKALENAESKEIDSQKENEILALRDNFEKHFAREFRRMREKMDVFEESFGFGFPRNRWHHARLAGEEEPTHQLKGESKPTIESKSETSKNSEATVKAEAKPAEANSDSTTAKAESNEAKVETTKEVKAEEGDKKNFSAKLKGKRSDEALERRDRHNKNPQSVLIFEEPFTNDMFRQMDAFERNFWRGFDDFGMGRRYPRRFRRNSMFDEFFNM